MKILMVDADEALLSFFAKELETRGLEIHQSVNGDEVLHVWHQLGPWDFVLTDYRFTSGTTIKGWNSVGDHNPRDEFFSADGYHDSCAHT
jgi:CheY-like chemotaxis protein